MWTFKNPQDTTVFFGHSHPSSAADEQNEQPEGTRGIRLSGNRGLIYGYFRLVAISVIQGIGSAANELPVGSCSSKGLRGAGSFAH